MHHITVDLLRESFYQLKRNSAAGMDGIKWKGYQTDIENRLENLHRKIHIGSYRPKPARRVYIPKEDGSKRPLSVISTEDKIVQQAVVNLLNCIYEVDFLGLSYGFRPGRSQHDALDALSVGIMRKKVNWVLDLDISKFFDTVERDWLIRFIERRVKDRRLLRLIKQWLKVGVLDGHGHRLKATLGTPQGAVISPLLANICLRYAFDLWALKWRRQPWRKEVVVVRCADDVVMGFRAEGDAVGYLQELKGRLASFGLELHPNKTRLIRFGRFAAEQLKERGQGKPETFDFLGFTHCCGRTRTGYFCIRRLTMKKRLRRRIEDISAELRRRMHDRPRETAKWLRTVVQGHINYYGVPFNSHALSLFCYEVKRRWYKSLCRRSLRKRINWETFGPLSNHWIPNPRIVHPYPEERFYANTRSRSRMR